MVQFHNFAELIYSWPIVALLLGLAIWVLGWKIYKAFIIVAGAFVGAMVLPQFFYDKDPMLFMILTFAGAIIGGLLAVWAMYAGLFILGVYSGLGIANYFLGFDGYYISLAIGAIVGLLFVVFFKFAVVYVTSFIGSYLIVTSSVLLLNLWLGSFWQNLSIFVLAVVGVLLQYKVWGAPEHLDSTLKKQYREQE
jgi:hypothetical protein